MKTIEEIENYIKEQEQNGALLVTGKWGSGKTYLMRQIERKLNQGPQYLMAVVSLFGIEDTNTLTKKVKEAVVYAQTFNKAEKSGKGHIAKGVNVVKQLSEKLKSLYYNAPCPSKNQHRGSLLQARFRPEVQNSVSFLAEGRRGWHRPIGEYCRLRC